MVEIIPKITAVCWLRSIIEKLEDLAVPDYMKPTHEISELREILAYVKVAQAPRKKGGVLKPLLKKFNLQNNGRWRRCASVTGAYKYFWFNPDLNGKRVWIHHILATGEWESREEDIQDGRLGALHKI
jgi:hypothetical protein